MPFCGEIFLYFRGLQVPREDKNFFPCIPNGFGCLELWLYDIRDLTSARPKSLTQTGRSVSIWYLPRHRHTRPPLSWQPGPAQPDLVIRILLKYYFNFILFLISPAAATTESDEGEAGRGAGEGRPGHSRQRSEVSRQILLAGIVTHFLSHWQ